MKFGSGLPIVAGGDTAALRDYVQALDDAGFDFLTTAGHILGVPRERHADRPPATFTGPFHDPFVLFGYLAGITQRLHFRPTILILPALPTALVAKQSAELQQLSGGRFELGVGISWNAVEYHALGQDFTTRGRRLEEQIQVLRRMWGEPYVTFDGRWHRLDGVGLNRVVSPPIPIWVGAGPDERVLRRVARVADGWIPLGDPTEALPRLRQYLTEAGRDPASFGLTARLILGQGGPEAWLETARGIQTLGATHLTLTTPPEVHGEAALKLLLEGRTALSSGLPS
ncbi:MAG TPA: LLM class F420-dependent oxidoreductase [Chloroflexota bacterium]|jgi:probable F420-dependent oxidoreductase|nr:LLM class F420-dependent oxidoreductase [Chloroflexota bacterium]